MKTRTTPGRAQRLLWAAGAMLTTAPCTPAAKDGAQAVGSEVPVIYVDRRIETLDSGRNEYRGGYEQGLAACIEGGRPTAPLGKEQVELIGTERWQLWVAPGRLAIRHERWSYRFGTGLDMCNFSLDVTGDHSYYDETQSVRLDLSTNERTISPPNPHALATGPAHAPDEQYLALVRQAGDTGPVKRMVAGQPCDEWRSPWGATTCIWSGGTQWGFTTQPDDQFMVIEGVYFDRIVLQAEPAAASIGDRLSTETFSLNAPLDLDRMLPTPSATSGR